MEILHSDGKRTVLAVLDGDKRADIFCGHLAEYFEIVRVGSARECLEVMHERFADLSVVIMDLDMAKADEYAFLREVAEVRLFDTIPILMAARRDLNDDDMRCLEEGATDFMLPPHHPLLMKRRIENAIRVKRSATFYEIERMLRELPSNIFLKDAEGRYVFATHYWHHLEMGDDPNWTIRGKTDLDIRKDRENALLAMEADRDILRTGEGTNYVIEINTDGIQEFMELIKRPVFDEDGNINGIIALINDVTETELLKRELEKRARTDGLTGLRNHRAYDEYLLAMQERDDFPIAVISADCDQLKMINDTYGHLIGDEYIRMAAMALVAGVPDGAEVFRTGGDEFVAFVPNAGESRAREIVGDIRGKCDLFKIKEHDICVSLGTSVIRRRGDSALDAIARADRSMYADKSKRRLARGERR